MESTEERSLEMHEGARQQRRRSVGIALALGALVILFFVMSIVQLHTTFH